MTDAAFVIAAYVAVLGGLAAYAFALGRRTAAARRLALSVERERDRDVGARAAAGPLVAGKSPEAGG